MIFEKIINDVILKEPNRIKYNERITVKIDKKGSCPNSPYFDLKGFYTEIQIHKEQIYLLVSNISIFKLNENAYDIINKIKEKQKIKDFFIENSKVITNYYPKCFYQIKDIDYNAKPNNISIKVRENDGSIKENSIIEYYEEK